MLLIIILVALLVIPLLLHKKHSAELADQAARILALEDWTGYIDECDPEGAAEISEVTDIKNEKDRRKEK